jgi:hypothetical protein
LITTSMVEEPIPEDGDADGDRDEGEGTDRHGLEDLYPTRCGVAPSGHQTNGQGDRVEHRDHARGGDEPSQLKSLDAGRAAETPDQSDERRADADGQQADQGEHERQDGAEGLDAERVLCSRDPAVVQLPRSEQDRQEDQREPTPEHAGEPPPARRRQVAVGEDQDQKRGRETDDGHPHRPVDRCHHKPEVPPSNPAVESVCRIRTQEGVHGELGSDSREQPADGVVRAA